MLSGARGLRVLQLLETAISIPSDQWEAFLNTECADDAEVRREVLEMLRVPASFLKSHCEDAAPKCVTGSGRRYEVGREIGRGSMGVVHIGYDPIMKRHVAIKYLQLSSLGELASLKKEAETAGKLHHPGIVP